MGEIEGVLGERTKGVLRFALGANGLFVFAYGLFLISLPNIFASMVQWSGPDMSLILSAILMGFATLLLWQGFRLHTSRFVAMVLSVVGLAGAIAAFGWIIASLSSLSLGGALALAVFPFVSALFSALQLYGIAVSYRREKGDYGFGVFEDITAGQEAYWRIVSQLGSISKYMPALSESRLIGSGDVGVGCVREVKTRWGENWTETVVGWSAPHSIDFLVDVNSPAFPYPFRRLETGWRVSEQQAGLYFIFEPKQALLMPFLMPLLELRYVPGMLAGIANIDQEAKEKQHVMELS